VKTGVWWGGDEIIKGRGNIRTGLYLHHKKERKKYKTPEGKGEKDWIR